MEFVLHFTDNYDSQHRRQEIASKIDEEDIFFCAEDLPEDEAKVGAFLFDCKDFVEVLRIGMKLAEKGYTSIKVVEDPWE